MDSTRLTACLACGSGKLVPFLNLGVQALANDYQTIADANFSMFPLKLNYCPVCFHAQQSIAVDPALLYTDYPYASGISATLRKYFANFVMQVEQDGPAGRLNVLEIASNDGSLLREFQQCGHIVTGVDPARNLAPLNIPTIPSYWNANALVALDAIGRTRFDVIVAMNVLGHVQDPLTFLTLAKSVLASGGRIYIQTSQADMLLNAEWDTCYHEHLSFFTVKSFITLATRAGLLVQNISVVPIHGNSYLFELTTDAGRIPTGDVATRLHFEQAHAFYQPGTYEAFQFHVQTACDSARTSIDHFRRSGWRVVGYGAAAKFVTFLNTAQLKLDIVVDDAPLKQGKYMPGVDALVMPLNDLSSFVDPAKKILWIIGAWNFAPEIIDRINNKRSRYPSAFMTLMPLVKLWPQSKQIESPAIPASDVERRTDL